MPPAGAGAGGLIEACRSNVQARGSLGGRLADQLGSVVSWRYVLRSIVSA